MARDGTARAFLKAAGGTVASTLLKSVAQAAAARGEHQAAHLARTGHAAIDEHAERLRAAYQRHRSGQNSEASLMQQLRVGLYDAALQLLHPPAAPPVTSSLCGPECFIRGVRDQQAGRPGAAHHWFSLGAAQGDRDCQRYLARMQGPPALPAPAEPSGPKQASAASDRAQALEVLGLREGASDDDIRAAFQRLMQQVHPDKAGGSEFFAKQLNLARRTLLG